MNVKGKVLLQLLTIFKKAKKWDQNVSRAKFFSIVKFKKLGFSASLIRGGGA